MEELWKSTSEVVRERVSSPILLPFAISWAAWNYKFFVVLFSGNSVLVTFELIRNLYPAWTHILVWPGQWGPLVTTLLVIFALPRLERWVLTRTLPTQRSILDLRRDHANATRLTLAESQALRAEMLRQESDHKKQYEVAEREVKAAEAQAERSDTNLVSAQAKLDADPFLLGDQETDLLTRFLNATGPGESIPAEDIKEYEAPQLQALIQRGFIREWTPKPGEIWEGSLPRFVISRAGAIRLVGKNAPPMPFPFKSEPPRYDPTPPVALNPESLSVLHASQLLGPEATADQLREATNLPPEAIDEAIRDLLMGGNLEKRASTAAGQPMRRVLTAKGVLALMNNTQRR